MILETKMKIEDGHIQIPKVDISNVRGGAKVIKENGKDVITIHPEGGKDFIVPLFESSGYFTVSTPEDLKSITSNTTDICRNRRDFFYHKLDTDHLLVFVRNPLAFIPVGGKPNGPARYFKNVESLLYCILNHKCKNIDICSYDDVLSRFVGFACNCGCWFKISIENIMKYKLDDLKNDMISSYFDTDSGRRKLSQLLTTKDDSLSEFERNKPYGYNDEDMNHPHNCNCCECATYTSDVFTLQDAEKGWTNNYVRWFEVIGMIGWNGKIEDIKVIESE